LYCGKELVSLLYSLYCKNIYNLGRLDLYMDFNGYGFDKKDSERFYQDMDSKKQEINEMDVDKETKKSLLSQADEVIKEYERTKIRCLNAEIYDIRRNSVLDKARKDKKYIESKLEERNHNTGIWKKLNVPRDHLMYKNNSWN